MHAGHVLASHGCMAKVPERTRQAFCPSSVGILEALVLVLQKRLQWVVHLEQFWEQDLQGATLEPLSLGVFLGFVHSSEAYNAEGAQESNVSLIAALSREC